MDRCHRMGQTRPVRVIKLATRSTVDERIVQIATSKLATYKALRLTADGADGGGDGAGIAAASSAPPAGHALMGSILRETLFPSQGSPSVERPESRASRPESAPSAVLGED